MLARDGKVKAAPQCKQHTELLNQLRALSRAKAEDRWSAEHQSVVINGEDSDAQEGDRGRSDSSNTFDGMIPEDN